MKGSAFIGLVAKECADLWPRTCGSIAWFSGVFVKKKNIKNYFLKKKKMREKDVDILNEGDNFVMMKVLKSFQWLN